eukprot:9192095-Lingulodinium_polyedra.AAC.1
MGRLRWQRHPPPRLLGPGFQGDVKRHARRPRGPWRRPPREPAPAAAGCARRSRSAGSRAPLSGRRGE